MGTRAGDVDAGVLAYLQRNGYDAAAVDALLNKKSGLLGLSGVASDMRAVKKAADAGDARAQLARDVFVERVRKYPLRRRVSTIQRSGGGSRRRRGHGSLPGTWAHTRSSSAAASTRSRSAAG